MLLSRIIYSDLDCAKINAVWLLLPGKQRLSERERERGKSLQIQWFRRMNDANTIYDLAIVDMIDSKYCYLNQSLQRQQ